MIVCCSNESAARLASVINHTPEGKIRALKNKEVSLLF
jgi:hypothetical protein